jgi:hypothetical protein
LRALAWVFQETVLEEPPGIPTNSFSLLLASNLALSKSSFPPCILFMIASYLLIFAHPHNKINQVQMGREMTDRIFFEFIRPSFPEERSNNPDWSAPDSIDGFVSLT